MGTIFTIYAQRKSNCTGDILQRKRIGALSLLYAQQKFLCSLSVPDIGRTILKRCWLLEKTVLVLYCAPILGYQGCPSFAPFLGYLRDAPLPTAYCLFPFNFMSPSSTIATHGFHEDGLSGLSSSLGYHCSLWAVCFHFTSTSTPLNIEGGECSSISPVYPVPSRMTYRRTLLLESSVRLLLLLATS